MRNHQSRAATDLPRAALPVLLPLLLSTASACAAPSPAAPPTSTSTAQAAAAVTRAGVSSNQEALRELQATSAAYLQAQQAFSQGDRARALELMNTAYLEHFERTEAWLDRAVSREYRQELEAAISRDLRRKLREGAPDADVAAQFPIALQRLAEAQARLAAMP
ncbi:MAG: hypothetical protein M3336_01815 [Chloroflexota bacterium]|nr:hypothetical protein [Chloroflexota bacterium]